MNKNLGLGVMLGILGGNQKTVSSLQAAIGCTIQKIWEENDIIKIIFTDDSKIRIWDDGQSCCESRYVTTDDELSDYVGAKILDFVLTDGIDQEDDYGVHEIQFFEIKTDKGVITFASHNEHNGYYGGFNIVADKW